MKLVRFEHKKTVAPGVLAGGRVLDLHGALGVESIEQLLAEGLLDRARSLARDDGKSAAWIPEANVRLLGPIARPSKIVGIGLNYRDHAAEQKVALPERPTLFAKFPNVLAGPGDPIRIPPGFTHVDYEAELAFVIGKRARRVARDRALEHVAGYMNMNDVTEREAQRGDKQWVRGKSFDGFGPCGPYLVTADETGDPKSLAIRLTLNGKVMQESSTRELVFGPAELVEFISATTTLEPGDVITTGTPSGVGTFREPPVYLKPGDVVTVEVEKLGALTNPVEAGA